MKKHKIISRIFVIFACVAIVMSMTGNVVFGEVNEALIKTSESGGFLQSLGGVLYSILGIGLGALGSALSVVVLLVAALGYMFDNCYIKFDTEMMICFIQHLVQNFIQYEVLLSDGQRGKIVMPNKKEPARPLIMVNGGFVDLAQRKDLTIKEMFY